MTPVPTRHPLASSLLTPVGMAPVVDIVFAPIVASHPQRTGRQAVRSAASFGTQVYKYSKFGRYRLKERRREEVISRNNRVLDEVSQARIVVSYVERRSG